MQKLHWIGLLLVGLLLFVLAPYVGVIVYDVAPKPAEPYETAAEITGAFAGIICYLGGAALSVFAGFQLR